nr:MAG TPA: Helix-turn-helix XRE-family like protein [Caudoviricetes sp.]
MVTMIEMGHRRPSLVLAMKLAEALGCSLSELVQESA